MEIIDSQCHVSPIWYEPVESLLFQMDRHNVAHAVLIQMLGQYDNEYQMACIKTHADRLSSVVCVNLTDPQALNHLRQAADSGACGVRLRPDSRSLGDDLFAIWRVAEECGLAISCVGSVDTFNAPEFAEVLSEVPRLPVVLEHFAGQARPDQNEDARTARLQGLSLSRFPNVFLKLPGFGELFPRLLSPPAEVTPIIQRRRALIDSAIEAFGAQRLMWGSDFPVVSSREGYGNALRGCLDACFHLSLDAKNSIFFGNAMRVFSIQGL